MTSFPSSKPDSFFTKIQLPASAVDVVLFTIKDNTLQVGLLQRHEDPEKNKYVLPGRFVRYDEPIETTASIALEEKCSIPKDKIILEQLYTFGQNLHRDTRIRTITIVYYAILPSHAFEKYTITWFPLQQLPQIGFDHKEIILYAVKRLQNKVMWDEFAFTFLPELFTLSELQKIYEIVLNETIDKRNFRKKIILIEGLKKTNQTKIE